MEINMSYLDTISNDHRYILQLIKVLRDDEKLTWEEVSDILGLPLTTVIHYWNEYGHLLFDVVPPK